MSMLTTISPKILSNRLKNSDDFNKSNHINLMGLVKNAENAKKDMSALLENIQNEPSGILPYLNLNRLSQDFTNVKAEIEQANEAIKNPSTTPDTFNQIKETLISKVKQLKINTASEIMDAKNLYKSTLVKAKDGIKNLKQQANKEIYNLEKQPLIKQKVKIQLENVLISLKNEDLNSGNIYETSKAKNDLAIKINLLQDAIQKVEDSLNIADIKPINKLDVLKNNSITNTLINAVGDLNDTINHLINDFKSVTNKLEAEIANPSKEIKEKLEMFSSSLNYVNFEIAKLSSNEHSNLVSVEQIYDMADVLAGNLASIFNKVDLAVSEVDGMPNQELLTKKIDGKFSYLFEAIMEIEGKLSHEQKSSLMALSKEIYDLSSQLDTNNLSLFLKTINEILPDSVIVDIVTNKNQEQAVDSLIANLNNVISIINNFTPIAIVSINIDNIKNNIEAEFANLTATLENLETSLSKNKLTNNDTISYANSLEPSVIVKKDAENKSLANLLQKQQDLFLTPPLYSSSKILDELKKMLDDIQLADVKDTSVSYFSTKTVELVKPDKIIDKYEKVSNNRDKFNNVLKEMTELHSHKSMSSFADELAELEENYDKQDSTSSNDSGVSGIFSDDSISSSTTEVTLQSLDGFVHLESPDVSVGEQIMGAGSEMTARLEEILSSPSYNENQKLRASIINNMYQKGFVQVLSKYLTGHPNAQWAKARHLQIIKLFSAFLKDTTDLKSSKFEVVFKHKTKAKGWVLSFNSSTLDIAKTASELKNLSEIQMGEDVFKLLKDLRVGRINFFDKPQDTNIWVSLVKPYFTAAFNELAQEVHNNQ